MPRSLDTAALAQIAEKVGVEPIIIIAIEWYPPIGNVPEAITQYADKDLPGIPGKILSITDLDEVIKLDVNSTTANITVTLDDTDGSIKALYDKYDIHKRPVTVWQYFAGLALSDAFEIFRGETNTPIIWSEGQRTITFDVYTRIYQYQSGFAPEEGQFSYIPDSLVGLPWPMCFGSPIHVPATKVANEVNGTIMNLFGIPDATLPYKLALAQYMQNELIEAYQYYANLIDTLTLNNQSAYDLQEEYAHFIVNSDALKQTFEDMSLEIESLNQQIDMLTTQYMSETETTPRTSLQSQIQTLTTTRNALSTKLQQLATQRAMLKFKDKEYKAKVQNIKHLRVTVVSELRKKCRNALGDYVYITQLIDQINIAMQNQSTLIQNSTVVLVGTDFPQLTTGLFQVKGQLFAGTMSGYILTQLVPQANYKVISVGPRLDDDVTSFWLDPTQTPINLTGMYLRLSNNRIVQVTQQDGYKVTCQLPRRSRNQRFKRRKVDYKDNQKIKDKFHAVLDGTLTGNETDDQIESIANIPPIDLSPKIWGILSGGNNSVTFTLTKPSDDTYQFPDIDLTKSYVQLIYANEEITENITFNMYAEDIQKAILNSTIAIDNNDFTVEISGFYPSGAWKDFTITFKKLMRRFRLFDVQVVNSNNQIIGTVYSQVNSQTPTTATLHLNDQEVLKPGTSLVLGGYYTLYCKGQSYNADPSATWTTIYNGLLSAGCIQAGEVTIIGGPVLTDDIVITYTDTFTSIFLDTSNLTFTHSDNSQINITDLKPGKSLSLQLQITGGGASEYTVAERQKIIDDAVDKNVNQPAIEKYRGAVRDAIAAVKAAKQNGAIDQATQEAVFNAQSALRALATKIDQTQFCNDEAYRLISDSEFDILFDLETLNYQEFINTLHESLETLPQDIDYQFTLADPGLTVLEASTIIMPNWLNWINGLDINEQYYETYLLPQNTSPFLGNVGDTITLAAAFQEKYVANIMPSTVLAVYAKKQVDGLTRMIPVPQSYYIKNENEYYGWYNCTTITLYEPLSRIDQSWQDGIYVTMTSSVGPNVCDVIAFLIERYTTLSVDTVSFAHVWTLQQNYPVNFARLQKEDVLTLCEDIAWQARCVIWIDRGLVFIRYLPETPTAYKTITETDIEQGSFEISCTPTEELITKFDITWRQDYAAPEDYTMTLRRNLYRYNEIQDSHEIFIYNDRSLVYKSATYWSMRRATCWKKASFRTFLTNIDLQTQDVILLSRADNALSTGAVFAIVEKAIYNSTDNSITITCWTPVPMGQLTPYTFAFPMLITNRYPLDTEIVVGDAGNPLNMQVPNNNNFLTSDFSGPDIRPFDFGTPNIGDTEDQLPNNPASAFSELQYVVLDNGVLKYNIDIQSDIDQTEIHYADLHQKEPESHKDYGPEATWSGQCRIIKFDSALTDSVTHVTTSYYKVQCSDGRVISAVCRNIPNDPIVQARLINSTVVVIYDKHFGLYTFQCPISLGVKPIPLD